LTPSSGLNTEPAPLIHPASYSRYRVCTWISLLTWWLTVGQVGLSQCAITHWVTITNFIPIYVESQGFGFTLARAAPCYTHPRHVRWSCASVKRDMFSLLRPPSPCSVLPIRMPDSYHFRQTITVWLLNPVHDGLSNM
jgi:hypothetical protein